MDVELLCPPWPWHNEWTLSYCVHPLSILLHVSRQAWICLHAYHAYFLTFHLCVCNHEHTDPALPRAGLVQMRKTRVSLLMVPVAIRFPVAITDSLWLSQSPCGYHRFPVVIRFPVAITESLWLSQIPCGYHRVPVAITDSMWLSQSPCGYQIPCGYHRFPVVIT